jgi:hypothetical protein
MCYFAGRSASMGAVGRGVVTATFYTFNPDLVAHCIPRAWDLTRPDAVIDARLAAVDIALNRLLGSDVIASSDMIAMAGLVRDAVSACSVENRPIFAAHADLDWPDAPHLVVWHGVSLLREYRGDGHVSALLAAGLSGIDAHVTHTASDQGLDPEFSRKSRGWTQDQWDGAIDGLAARGLLDSDSALTSTGLTLRAQIEDETDRMAAPPWQYLGDERTDEVIRIGRALTRAVQAAGAFSSSGVGTLGGWSAVPGLTSVK